MRAQVMDQHQKAIAKLMHENSGRYRTHEVFRDFCEMTALSLSNAVDRVRFDQREKRYLEIIKRYEKKEVDRFPLMFAELVESLGGSQIEFKDSLGQLFMDMEMGCHLKGQFFTPYPISSMMARMVAGDVNEKLKDQEFVTVNEPACGSGGMIVALAEALKDSGVNYQQKMHAVLQDVDPTSVHMAYIQMTLYHVPAVVIHGNTLSMEQWNHWYTPAHILDLWDIKLARRMEQKTQPEKKEITVTVPDHFKQLDLI